jgi:hypothetical protein
MGSDMYKPTCIRVCVRFSSAFHTELVEQQISRVKQKLPHLEKLQ